MAKVSMMVRVPVEVKQKTINLADLLTLNSDHVVTMSEAVGLAVESHLANLCDGITGINRIFFGILARADVGKKSASTDIQEIYKLYSMVASILGEVILPPGEFAEALGAYKIEMGLVGYEAGDSYFLAVRMKKPRFRLKGKGQTPHLVVI